jgi:YegS/Rv2252/BmrU family lipid kinase
MDKRAFIVFNPVAGNEDPDDLRAVIEQRLDDDGWEYILHTTTKDEDIEQVTRNALPGAYDLIVAVGGDGTVSGVAGGLVDASTPMGIIPSGTGNALARYLDIPSDPVEAVKLLTQSETSEPLDALRVGQKHYFLNLSVGVSAATMRDTRREQKRSLGFIAYLIQGVKDLLGIQPARFEIVIDGATFSVRAADIVVLNDSLLGSVLLSDEPELALDTGEVGVLIFKAKSALDYLAVVWRALWNIDQSRRKHLRTLRASRRVMIKPDRPLPVQADGEPLDLRSVTAYIVPKAVKVIRPDDRGKRALKVLPEQLSVDLLSDMLLDI